MSVEVSNANWYIDVKISRHIHIFFIETHASCHPINAYSISKCGISPDIPLLLGWNPSQTTFRANSQQTSQYPNISHYSIYSINSVYPKIVRIHPILVIKVAQYPNIFQYIPIFIPNLQYSYIYIYLCSPNMIFKYIHIHIYTYIYIYTYILCMHIYLYTLNRYSLYPIIQLSIYIYIYIYIFICLVICICAQM